MEYSDELHRLCQQAETLKCDLWSYMERKHKFHKGVKEAMNLLLDYIEEIDEMGENNE